MRFKSFVPHILAVSLFAATVPAFCQVGPQYETRGFPLTVGAGASSWDVDWGQGRMYGEAAWADWYPRSMPSMLRGLGLEAEGRDIRFDKHLQPNNGDPERSGQANTVEDTLGGGPIYAWRHFHFFHPYGKCVFSIGSVDFISPSPTYSHDTRTVIASGGGFEARMYGPLWVRADYEYQDWVGPLLHNTLNPQGFTVGVSYDFSHANR